MQRHSYILFSLALLIGITSIQAAAADSCKKYLNKNDLTSSKHGIEKTALYCYNSMLKQDPNNQTALDGIKEIEARYVKWVKKAMKRGQKTKVNKYLKSLRLVNPDSQALAELEAKAHPKPQPVPEQPIVEQPPVKQPIAKAPVAEPPAAVEPPPAPKQANITDLGQIYEALNTTECITWPSEEAKKKGGKNGWGSFYPKKGDTGTIIATMKHCHLEDNVYILELNQYYVAISSTGIEIVE